MSASYIMCTQDVGAGVGSAAGCITCRKHRASGRDADKVSSEMYPMTSSAVVVQWGLCNL